VESFVEVGLFRSGYFLGRKRSTFVVRAANVTSSHHDERVDGQSSGNLIKESC